MAPFHVLKKNYLQNFNLNYKGAVKPTQWAFQRPECSPIFDMKVAQSEDREKLLQFARTNFYRDEPLRTSSLPTIQEPEDEKFHMDKISQGTCIMAVKPDFNDTIVGAVIAAPKVRYQLAYMAKDYNSEYSKWGRILKLWAQAENEANIYERYGVTRLLHAYLLAVHRDYRGYGLGQRLLRELARVGKKLGYEAISIDATSEFAACSCQDYNMQLMNTMCYQDYRDEKGYNVFVPHSPHHALRTYAKRLVKVQ